MLAQQIKDRMFAAMKARHTVEKEILRVALGEIQTDEARRGEKLSDEEVVKILRKLVKSNGETIGLTADAADKATLEEENRVLETLLPKTLDESEVVAALATVSEAILAAGSDGQATGVAMKHLKSSGAVVDGKTVSTAVRTMRAG
ncbi:MAG: GatB/YqeY domain-containing protein [Polyangiaceae bacterium]|jgi:hypothetical protein